LVLTDCFNTSLVITIQLLLMGFYTVGIIMPNRIGFANTGVFLCTGSDLALERVIRREKTAKSIRPLTHVQYIRKLRLELINLQGEDMYDGNTFGADSPSSISARSGDRGDHPKHAAKQVDEWRNHSGQLKRAQQSCKVCSLHRTGGKRGKTATYFCDACYALLPGYLCMKPKYTVEGELRSCWDIWHRSYKNGTGIPENLQGKIRLRQSPAKRRHVSAEEEKAPTA
ncbi:Hypothetical protein PHPALM_16120, partial [Phytophthora palmivora]